jgi:hypothetical protein
MNQKAKLNVWIKICLLYSKGFQLSPLIPLPLSGLRAQQKIRNALPDQGNTCQYVLKELLTLAKF